MASVSKRTWTHNGKTKTAWAVRWSDQEGKRRLKTFDLGDKKAADKYRRKVEDEIEKGVHNARASSITVTKACDDWLEHCQRRMFLGKRMTRGTYEGYRLFVRLHIVPYLGNKKLSDLTAPVIQQWVDGLQNDTVNPRSHKTVAGGVTSLRLAITRAQRLGQIGHNVLRECRPEIDKPTSRRVEMPEKEDVRCMLEASTDRMRAVLHVAVFTGMRLGEIFGLAWRNVDFEAREIHVKQRLDAWGQIGQPKSTAGDRVLPIGDELVTILLDWRRSLLGKEDGNVVMFHNDEVSRSEFVFPSKAGTPYLKQHFHSREWTPFMRGIGMMATKRRSKFRFHALRHFAISSWIEKGLQPKQIQRLAGHASIQLTFDTYGHLFKDQTAERDAIRAIEGELVG